MAKEYSPDNGQLRRRSFQEEEEEEAKVSLMSNEPVIPLRSPKPSLPRRQSSLAQQRPPGTPRTPNRVRFDVEEAARQHAGANGHADRTWLSEEDPMPEDDSGIYRNGHVGGQRLPLLTGIEAPSITLANDMDFDAEDHLENARPKSGMQSAFMNMANSIM